jgi:D-xylose 1-dehydrogenase (NADP+, D-xylono-1,5-lactone-forming)
MPSTRSRLRWGLLGTARINRSLIPAIRAGERSELAAVASRDASRADAYAREWEIPRAFDSYEALVADPDIDVVYIPLPNHLHVEWTVAAARAGKHVLCEKPIALGPAGVDRIAEAARAGKVAVAEAFMYRHQAQTDRVMALIAEGAIGRLRFLRGTFSFPLTREGDVRLTPEWGGGALWDVGCYPVTYAMLVAGGPPVVVSGRAEHGPTGIDVTFAGVLEFADGMLGAFDCGFKSVFRTSMEIVGTDGVLHIGNPFKPGPRETIHFHRDGVETPIAIEGAALYSGEIADIERAALDGQPCRVSLAQSRASVATLCALYESARAGRQVRVLDHTSNTAAPTASSATPNTATPSPDVR